MFSGGTEKDQWHQISQTAELTAWCSSSTASSKSFLSIQPSSDTSSALKSYNKKSRVRKYNTLDLQFRAIVIPNL